jgi:hypothetical protein
MPRKRKKVDFDLKSFLHRIINGMSSQELIESGIVRSILRCISADEIYEALTPKQREEALPILRRMVEADERVAAAHAARRGA